jgi:hypothetical protein
MTKYEVQFTLPCEDPVNNVKRGTGKRSHVFEVPINHPAAHNMGFQDLIAAQGRSGLFTVSSTLNNKRLTNKG